MKKEKRPGETMNERERGSTVDFFSGALAASLGFATVVTVGLTHLVLSPVALLPASLILFGSYTIK
jgi:hypothetical protein